MKKKSIYLLVMLAAMSMSACNNSSGGNGKIPSNITYSDEKVVNSELISANAEEYEYGQTLVRYAENLDTIYFQDSMVYNTSYRSSGLLITKNYSGYIGFYSLIHGDYILKPQFVENWLQYSVTSVSRIGFLLKIRYNDQYSVYDGFGNKLFDENVTFTSASYTTVNEKFYLTLGIEYYGNRYYEYSSNGSVTEVYYIPSEQVPVDEYEGPLFQDLYTYGWMNLAEFGLPNYDIAYTSECYMTVFELKTPICSFYIDLQTNTPLSIIGDKFLFQKTAVMPNEDVADYSFIRNGSKYDLEHTMVSLKTGEKKITNYNVVFTGEFERLVTPGGDDTYLLATYQKVNSNKMLGDRMTSVVDKNFVFHEDVSGAHLANFVKYKNENGESVYFNTQTKILYNSNLQIITYLGNMNPQFSERLNMFVGSINGYYGIVDLHGITRLEFRYTQIYPTSFYNGHGLATIGSNVYNVNLSYTYGNENPIGTNLTYIDENLFYYDSNDGLVRYFYSAKDGVLLSVENGYYSASYSTYLNDNRVYYVITRDYQNVLDRLYVVKYDDFKPHAIDSEIQGQELESTIYDGTSYDNAQPLSLGNNNVHTTNGNYFYVSYVAQAKATYFLYYDYYLTLYSSYTNTGTRNGYRYVGFTLDEGEMAVVEFYRGSSISTQLTYMYLERDYGQYANYYYDFSGSATNFFACSSFTQESSYTFGLTFTAPRSAHYTVECMSNNNTITSVMRGSSNVTNGLDLGINTTVNLVVNFNYYVESRIQFRLVIDDITTPAGSTEDMPIDLTFGTHTDAIELPDYNPDFPHAFLRFAPSQRGVYVFSLYFSRTVSYQYKTYDQNGEVYFSGEGSTSNLNLSSGVRFREYESQYIIFKITLESTATTYVNSYTINATSGNAVENPIALDAKTGLYLNTNGYFAYYTFDYGESFDGYVNVQSITGDVSLYMMVNGNITPMSLGDNPVTISDDVENNPIIIVVGNNNSYAIVHVTQEISQYYSIDEGGYYSPTVGQNFYRFTNTTNSTMSVRLSYSDTYFNGGSAVISDGFLLATPNSSFSSNTTYYVGPGKSLSIYISNSDYPNSQLYVEIYDVGQYSLNLSHEGYSWVDYGSYYESGNAGVHSSTSAMSILVNANGTLSLQFFVSSESGCDYLYIYINSTQYVSQSGTNMTAYDTFEYQVYAGDYVYIYYTKDGSINNGNDCARIKNIIIY